MVIKGSTHASSVVCYCWGTTLPSHEHQCPLDRDRGVPTCWSAGMQPKSSPKSSTSWRQACGPPCDRGNARLWQAPAHVIRRRCEVQWRHIAAAVSRPLRPANSTGAARMWSSPPFTTYSAHGYSSCSALGCGHNLSHPTTCSTGLHLRRASAMLTCGMHARGLRRRGKDVKEQQCPRIAGCCASFSRDFQRPRCAYCNVFSTKVAWLAFD